MYNNPDENNFGTIDKPEQQPVANEPITANPETVSQPVTETVITEPAANESAPNPAVTQNPATVSQPVTDTVIEEFVANEAVANPSLQAELNDASAYPFIATNVDCFDASRLAMTDISTQSDKPVMANPETVSQPVTETVITEPAASESAPNPKITANPAQNKTIAQAVPEPESSFVAQELVYAQPKKERHRFGIGSVVAMVAICALLSGAIGSGMTALFINGALPSSADYANNATVVQSEAPVGVSAVAKRTGETLSVAEISAKVGPSVVSIIADVTVSDMFGRSGTETGSGSGVIVSEDGYILTNNHVVEGANALNVTLDSGEEYSAILVGADSQTDLAVIKIDATGLSAAVLGDSAGIQVGDTAIAIGNPLGELTGTVTTGIISATDREITIENEKMNLLQTDAAVNPGNSGGALCNAYGEVIGLVNAKTSALGVEGLGFAIPINDAKVVMEQLIRDGRVTGRASLGISVQEIPQEAAAMFGMKEGVYVQDLAQGGAADNAGIQIGDRIIKVDGKDVATAADVKEIIGNHSAGDKIQIVVNRSGKDVTVTIALLEAQAKAA
jgi:serine protease Do